MEWRQVSLLVVVPAKTGNRTLQLLAKRLKIDLDRNADIQIDSTALRIDD